MIEQIILTIVLILLIIFLPYVIGHSIDKLLNNKNENNISFIVHWFMGFISLLVICILFAILLGIYIGAGNLLIYVN